MIGPATEPTRRVTLKIDEMTIDQFIRVELVHDLSELASSFQLGLRDELRSLETWDWATAVSGEGGFNWGKRCEVFLDGELWCIGWVDDVMPDASNGPNGVTIVGRDITGDLVDCPPDPRGEHEYRDITLTEFAEKLCKPFGIKVRAEVDVSPKFDKCVVEAGETVLSAIAKYAKQRGVLVTSDRVGTVVITRSGQQPAAGAIQFPGNVTRSRASFSARERFSDYFVKGQSEKNGGKRAKAAPLDATADPLDSAPMQAPPATDNPEDVPEGAGTLVMGHAQDKEVTRWRPFIAMARTKATAFDAQRQAEWEMRTRRGKGDKLDYGYRGFRGETGQIWKPNTSIPVSDRYARLDRAMLLAGVRATYDERGEATRLRITGPEAYDLLPEGDRRSNQGGKSGKSSSAGSSSGGKLDGTARPL
jgi:prophage tail gpP-like protein